MPYSFSLKLFPCLLDEVKIATFLTRCWLYSYFWCLYWEEFLSLYTFTWITLSFPAHLCYQQPNYRKVLEIFVNNNGNNNSNDSLFYYHLVSHHIMDSTSIIYLESVSVLYLCYSARVQATPISCVENSMSFSAALATHSLTHTHLVSIQQESDPRSYQLWYCPSPAWNTSRM